ncbi:hypothetical protein LIER_32912 [Lithospermum erythrorhizon]|uniref:Uncharacterized protein n=1 Tax=Lithospermum erythrorhizon TaxID=34254 RepID=A0AAV3RXG7_LITER
MATINNFLCLSLFLIIITQGMAAKCYPGRVTIYQKPTGRRIHHKTEWKVSVANECACMQLNVRLSCAGFHSLRFLSPSVLSKSGNLCIINNNNPISPFSTFNFTYVWDHQFVFAPVSSQEACS